MNGPYDDIINLPHHVSTTRPKMSLENRAAQFSPFAALTGYDAAVKEKSRITDKRVELDENAMDILDMKLHMLAEGLNNHSEVNITYFKPDEKKEGGAYITVLADVKRIDSIKKAIILANDEKIMINDILDIDIELI